MYSASPLVSTGALGVDPAYGMYNRGMMPAAMVPGASMMPAGVAGVGVNPYAAAAFGMVKPNLGLVPGSMMGAGYMAPGLAATAAGVGVDGRLYASPVQTAQQASMINMNLGFPAQQAAAQVAAAQAQQASLMNMNFGFPAQQAAAQAQQASILSMNFGFAAQQAAAQAQAASLYGNYAAAPGFGYGLAQQAVVPAAAYGAYPGMYGGGMGVGTDGMMHMQVGGMDMGHVGAMGMMPGMAGGMGMGGMGAVGVDGRLYTSPNVMGLAPSAAVGADGRLYASPNGLTTAFVNVGTMF